MLDRTFIRLFKMLYGIRRDISQREMLSLNQLHAKQLRLFFLSLLISICLELLLIDGIFALSVLVALVIFFLENGRLVKSLQLDKIFVRKEQLASAKKNMLQKTFWDTLVYLLVSLGIGWLLWEANIPQEHGDHYRTYWQLAVPIMVVMNTSLGFVTAYFGNRRKIILI
ncbi:hypothetical protein [Streptococcus plurextorum]|uniref:hypothetical protein n=1 Tax=Streptococcus plurextorum TaxID=456876 RepID=UPI00041E9158|nr:hypothetical protein [Streptococcus plurextorum]